MEKNVLVNKIKRVIFTEEENHIIDILYAEYNKMYNNTKPGEHFPVWFNDAQLKMITKTLKAK
jgi:hypothetical protein